MKRCLPLIATSLVVLAACAEPPDSASPAPDADQRYTASATVLQSEKHGPQLCLGAIADSLPPQCDGPDIVNWNWDTITGERTGGTTTWGEYVVVGTYVDGRFTLTEPAIPASDYTGPPLSPPAPSIDFSSRCPAPPGGWRVLDPARTTHETLEATMSRAAQLPGYGGAWVDQSINPAGQSPNSPPEAGSNDPTKLVVNVMYTGDLARPEAELRKVWGGALCLSKAARTEAELRDIQQELTSTPGMLGIGVFIPDGIVQIDLILDTGVLQSEFDKKYGADVVKVRSALTKV